MLARSVRSVLQVPAKGMADLVFDLLGLVSIRHLENQLEIKNFQLQQLEEQEQALYRVISKIRASLELETIFRTTTKETCKLLKVERVAVYRFREDWGGEFVHDFEFAEPGWDDTDTFEKHTVLNDSYIQEQKGGRYRGNETLVVSDVAKLDYRNATWIF